MAQLHEYDCPKCGGALEFNPEVQKLKCLYCESEYTIEEVQHVDEVLDKPETEQQNTKPDTEDSSESSDGLISYLCKSCGGEILGDANLAASSCPYCGNPIIMMGQFTGDFKPDYIIPFKVDKKAAKAGLLKHLEGKKLLPRVFKDENHIDEIKGIYVPFWFYDSVATADITFSGKKIRTWEDNDFSYKEVSSYSLLRKGALTFDDVPVDGSEKMDNTLMESIEPFDFSQAEKFHTGYLAGYFADKFDVDSADCKTRAYERIFNSTLSAFANTLDGYENVAPEKTYIEMTNTVAKYTLCPVWLLNTSWKGEKFTFAMNGQTGKFVGNLPADKGLLKKYFFTISSVSAVIVYLILTFFLG